jgi:hypothetical protein
MKGNASYNLVPSFSRTITYAKVRERPYLTMCPAQKPNSERRTQQRNKMTSKMPKAIDEDERAIGDKCMDELFQMAEGIGYRKNF